MVPAGAGVPGAASVNPLRDQVTPMGSPVAVNCMVWPVPTAALCGLSEMVMDCVCDRELPQPAAKISTERT